MIRVVMESSELVTAIIKGAERAFTAFFDLGVGIGAPFAGLVASLAGGR